MLANSYKHEQDILPVEIGNALYTLSMELNLDLQRFLTTWYSTITFSYFFQTFKSIGIWRNIVLNSCLVTLTTSAQKKNLTLPGSVPMYKDAVSTAGTI